MCPFLRGLTKKHYSIYSATSISVPHISPLEPTSLPQPYLPQWPSWHFIFVPCFAFSWTPLMLFCEGQEVRSELPGLCLRGQVRGAGGGASKPHKLLNPGSSSLSPGPACPTPGRWRACRQGSWLFPGLR